MMVGYIRLFNLLEQKHPLDFDSEWIIYSRSAKDHSNSSDSGVTLLFERNIIPKNLESMYCVTLEYENSRFFVELSKFLE